MSLFSFLRKNKQDPASAEMRYSRVDNSEPGASRVRGKGRKSGQGREAVDPMLPEKKRARRRLIGAIALVLAAIIGLPMLLDTEPRPLADDIAIQIPSKDKPAQQPRPAPKSQPSSDSNAGLPAMAALDPKEEVIEPPPASKAPEARISDKQTAAPAQAPVMPAPESKAAAPAPTSSPKPAHELKAVTPPASAGGKDSKNSKDNKDGKDVKESREVARQHVEPAKSESRHETKSESSRIEAAKEAAKKPAPEKPSASESPARDEKALSHIVEKTDDSARAKALLEGKTDPKDASDRNGNANSKYLVQVAALASQEKVTELQTRLRDAGIKSYTQKIVTESGDRIRIRVGPFASREEADKVRARISRLGLGGTIVPS